MTVPVLNTISMPWDNAGMSSAALSSRFQMPWLATLMPILGAPPQTSAARRPGSRVCDLPDVQAKRRRILATAAESEVDDERYVQIRRWLMIAEVDPHASQVGKHVLAVQDDVDAETKVQGIIDDVLAGKSTSTLKVRSTAILLYLKWHN